MVRDESEYKIVLADDINKARISHRRSFGIVKDAKTFLKITFFYKLPYPVGWREEYNKIGYDKQRQFFADIKELFLKYGYVLDNSAPASLSKCYANSNYNKSHSRKKEEDTTYANSLKLIPINRK